MFYSCVDVYWLLGVLPSRASLLLRLLSSTTGKPMFVSMVLLYGVFIVIQFVTYRVRAHEDQGCIAYHRLDASPLKPQT